MLQSSHATVAREYGDSLWEGQNTEEDDCNEERFRNSLNKWQLVHFRAHRGPTPDYTTSCRRQSSLEAELPRRVAEGVVPVVIDATGLKVFGKDTRRPEYLVGGGGQDGRVRARRLLKIIVSRSASLNSYEGLIECYKELHVEKSD